eukprot:TRINITY_DN10680_c0_g2_i2.p1 TRINITY_DN10680_c0_g2~~TRINITY_DN10680_c0_g2_i2.p1  ORF type:complete len:363 (-),score=84.25 TRINITY_DN10680_c0_g2_i2:227-1315(-)
MCIRDRSYRRGKQAFPNHKVANIHIHLHKIIELFGEMDKKPGEGKTVSIKPSSQKNSRQKVDNGENQNEEEKNKDPSQKSIPVQKRSTQISSKQSLREKKQSQSSKQQVQQNQQQQMEDNDDDDDAQQVRSLSRKSGESASKKQAREIQQQQQQQYGINYNQIMQEKQEKQQDGRIGLYEEEEENIVCARFPHLDFCACQPSCIQQISSLEFKQAVSNLYIGNFVSGLATKKLLSLGITHILNLTASEYKKRTKYFKYLNIDVYDKSDEDIKKHFRITNRFIKQALDENGKVLIQDRDGKNIAPSFALAFMINNNKIPLKNGLEVLKSEFPNLEISSVFLKQLERYDLEKLALVTLKKKEIQ